MFAGEAVARECRTSLPTPHMKEIIRFKIVRISKGIEEDVLADQLQEEGHELVFLRQGKEVARYLRSSLEKMPEPQYAMTPEERKRWGDMHKNNPRPTGRKFREE